MYSTDYGWGLFKEDEKNGGASAARYRRTYTWNEKNQLISSVDANYNTAYVYGQDGQRSNKYTQSSETLYFNKMWTLHTDSGNSVYGGQSAKNIYLGETRIVTKLNSGSSPTYQEEYYKQYYYHSDHLGSASLISDYKGDEYQRIEYTPYGETWVEKTSNTGLEFLPYKFTAKELDKETGLYYYGARYLDPKYSRWLSTDPALGEYIPEMGKGNDKDSVNLPGMGGVYNHINFQLYHYAGNNPIRYIDPDGRYSDDWIKSMPSSARKYIKYMEPNRFSQQQWTVEKGFNSYEIDLNGKKVTKYFWQTACFATAILNIVSAVYQNEKNSIMTETQAIGALNAAIKAGYIDVDDAYVSNIPAAANAMASYLNLKGSFTNDESSPQYMIYAIDKKTYKHFVNAIKNIIGSKYFDVWGGKIKNYSMTTVDNNGVTVTENLVNLQESRPIRGLNYNVLEDDN